jgi:hypothetical protein
LGDVDELGVVMEESLAEGNGLIVETELQFVEAAIGPPFGYVCSGLSWRFEFVMSVGREVLR